MLVNLRLDKPEIENNRLLFDLPPISFRQGQSVSISKMHIQWNKGMNNLMLYLCTTLIDKSSCNPRQQLLFTYQRNLTKHLHYTPTQKEYYKIQCMDLQSAEFYLYEFNNKKIEQIETIFLQLEILDERIQSIAQKPA